MCLNFVGVIIISPFFGLGLWVIHNHNGVVTYFTLMTPFHRYLSKLSENHIIVDIGSTTVVAAERLRGDCFN